MMAVIIFGSLFVLIGCIAILAWPLLSNRGDSFEERIARSKWYDL